MRRDRKNWISGFAALIFCSGIAVAQDCSTGTCQRPVRNAVTAVATPVVNLTEVAVSTAGQAVQFAACSTQKVAIAATKPAKRVFSLRRARCCR